MKVPYRYRLLAIAADKLIQSMKSYRKDAADSQIAPARISSDLSDLIGLSLTDAGFTNEQQRALAAFLISELKAKYDVK